VTFPAHSRQHPIRLLRGATAPARVAAGAAIVATAVAGCGSSGPAKLVGATVARAIEQRIEKQSGVATAVNCAAPGVIKVGAAFRCSAKLAVGTYAVSVVAIDAKGNFRYSSSGPLRVLDSVAVEHAIARSIRRQLHARSSVTCPAPVLQRAGISFGCVATTKRGVVHRFKVTELDGGGRVDIVDLTPKPRPRHHKAKAHHTRSTRTHTSSTRRHTK
jgi:hypothetical protein